MTDTKLPLVQVPIVDYGSAESDMASYREDGTNRALQLDNRGPIRFGDDGHLHPEIIDAYSRHGFYVLTDVIDQQELKEIEADVAMMLDRSPITKDAEVDKHGNPALGVGLEGRNISWVRPLSDPLGGTDASYGRHEAKMNEPAPPAEAPDHVVQLFLGSLQFSDACLRLYGHPELLKVAEAVNGPDFTPFNDAIFIKPAGLGGSVAWHQDGLTHWDSPDWDEGIHGFNFQVQLYPSTPSNGLWVMPGTHKQGKIDIKSLVKSNGSERLAGAVPLFCNPGDVTITNRQALHCPCLLYTSPSPRDGLLSRMPSSA